MRCLFLRRRQALFRQDYGLLGAQAVQVSLAKKRLEVRGVVELGHLLQLLKKRDEAHEAFTRAASLTDDPALREYLFKRSNDCV